MHSALRSLDVFVFCDRSSHSLSHSLSRSLAFRYFGVAQTDYDFEARDPKAAQRELRELSAQQEALAKKINKKVHPIHAF